MLKGNGKLPTECRISSHRSKISIYTHPLTPAPFSFPFCLPQCWDDCSTATTVNRPVTGTTWPLAVTSMVRDGSLVATNVAWHSEAPGSPMALSDCLVTWEVSGGGLIGNLLTSTSFVELSLWPNTKYRIQVTCKRKVCTMVFAFPDRRRVNIDQHKSQRFMDFNLFVHTSRERHPGRNSRE